MAEDTPIGKVDIHVKADERGVQRVGERVAQVGGAPAGRGGLASVGGALGAVRGGRVGAAVGAAGGGAAAAGLGPVGIAAAAAAASLFLLAKITKRLIAAHDEQVRRLAMVNPAFAAMHATAAVNVLMRDIRRARQLAPATLAVHPDIERIKDILADWKTDVTQKGLELLELIFKLLEKIGINLEPDYGQPGVNDRFLADINQLRFQTEQVIPFTPAPPPPPPPPAPHYKPGLGWSPAPGSSRHGMPLF